MILYDPKIHEPLLVAWHFHLKEDPQEYADLFMEPLRNLTGLLPWAANDVKLMIAWDARGLWAASWVEPVMSGAFFGLWLRQDMRGTPAAVAFANHSYDKALEHFPVLIGITKQPRLHAIHLRMGYEYVGTVEHLFDDAPARVYKMTKETRNGRRRKDLKIEHIESLRIGSGELRNVGQPAVQAIGGTDLGSTANGRGKRPDPDHQPQRGRGKKRVQQQPEDHARKPRAQRAVGVKLRTADNGRAGNVER